MANKRSKITLLPFGSFYGQAYVISRIEHSHMCTYLSTYVMKFY